VSDLRTRLEIARFTTGGTRDFLFGGASGQNARYVDTAPNGDAAGYSVLLSGRYVIAAGDAGHGVAVARLVNDEPPTARFTAAAQPGQTLAFDGSGSRDDDGPLAGYAWDFGDGEAGAGPSTAHTYAVPGTYHVTLTVTEGGATASVAKDVSVASTAVPVIPPPTAPFTPALAAVAVAGRPKAGATSVTEVVTCTGSPGTGCRITVLLSGLEKMRGSRVVAVTARKLKTKRVTIGVRRVTVGAGNRTAITVKLNRTGMALLKRFKRLPARLVVSQDTKTLVTSKLRFTTKRGR
jgi:hypothetical protein